MRKESRCKMFKSCKYCGKIHKSTEICERKPKQKYYSKRRTKIDWFRSSFEWQSARAEALERDKHLCRYCLPKLITTRNLQVHHIIPIRDSWSKKTDVNNLITLCAFHHRLAEMEEIPASELQKIVSTPLQFF